MFSDMEKANAIASKPGSLRLTNCSCRVRNPEGGACARLPRCAQDKGGGYDNAARVAPGSNCAAWQLAIEACRYDLHRLPWSDLVALGESLDFDAESGDCSIGATQVRLGNLIDVCPTKFAAESLPSFALSLIGTESNSRNFASEG